MRTHSFLALTNDKVAWREFSSLAARTKIYSAVAHTRTDILFTLILTVQGTNAAIKCGYMMKK